MRECYYTRSRSSVATVAYLLRLKSIRQFSTITPVYARTRVPLSGSTAGLHFQGARIDPAIGPDVYEHMGLGQLNETQPNKGQLGKTELEATTSDYDNYKRQKSFIERLNGIEENISVSNPPIEPVTEHNEEIEGNVLRDQTTVNNKANTLIFETTDENSEEQNLQSHLQKAQTPATEKPKMSLDINSIKDTKPQSMLFTDYSKSLELAIQTPVWKKYRFTGYHNSSAVAAMGHSPLISYYMDPSKMITRLDFKRKGEFIEGQLTDILKPSLGIVRRFSLLESEFNQGSSEVSILKNLNDKLIYVANSKDFLEADKDLFAFFGESLKEAKNSTRSINNAHYYGQTSGYGDLNRYHDQTVFPELPKNPNFKNIAKYVNYLTSNHYGKYSEPRELVSKVLWGLIESDYNKFMTAKSYHKILEFYFFQRDMDYALLTIDRIENRFQKLNSRFCEAILKGYIANGKEVHHHKISKALDYYRKHNPPPTLLMWHLLYIGTTNTSLRLEIYHALKNDISFFKILSTIAADMTKNELMSYFMYNKKVKRTEINELCMKISVDLIESFKDDIFVKQENLKVETLVYNGVIHGLLQMNMFEEAASFMRFSNMTVAESTVSRFVFAFVKKRQIWAAIATINYFLANFPQLRRDSASFISYVYNPIWSFITDVPTFKEKFTLTRILYLHHLYSPSYDDLKNKVNPSEREETMFNDMYKMIKANQKLAKNSGKKFKACLLSTHTVEAREAELNIEYRLINDVRFRRNYGIRTPKLDNLEKQYYFKVFKKLTWDETPWESHSDDEHYSFIDLTKIDTDSQFNAKAKALGYFKDVKNMEGTEDMYMGDDTKKIKYEDVEGKVATKILREKPIMNTERRITNNNSKKMVFNAKGTGKILPEN